MHEPTWLQRTGDTLAVWWHGGVRVRVWDADGEPQGSISGGASTPQAAHFLRAVLELKPKSSGVVDFLPDGQQRWRVVVQGAIAQAQDGFEQRLRNVVANPR